MPEVERLQQALGSLDRFFRGCGAPLAGALRPGLSESQLHRIEAELGFELPDEVHIWFRWHDGADKITNVPPGYTYLPTLQYLLPLDRSLAFRALFLERKETVKLLPIHEYETGWLPVTGSDGAEGALAVDCYEPAAGTLHVVTVRGEDDWALPSGSLTDLAELWVKVAEGGYWRWDRQAHDWAETFSEIPVGWRLTGLLD